ncbi:MAG: NAD(P)-dependent oxidoreductase [Verrucomicrobiota bacterium]
MSTTVSVLGLGIIGEIWARNLAADGFPILTWNRTPKPQASGHCEHAARAAESARFIFIVVADPPAVASVLDQIEPVLNPGQTVIQSSTIDPESSRAFATRVEATGAAFLEAPFTGSKPAAEARETVFYTGGRAEVLAEARQVLGPLSKSIHHFGEVGTASTLKLAMNTNIALIAEALCESLTFAREHGATDDQFFEALNANVGRSGVSGLKEAKLRAGDYATQFSVKHMAKDLRLALQTADADAPLPLLRKMVAQYNQAENDGRGELDFISLIELLRR